SAAAAAAADVVGLTLEDVFEQGDNGLGRAESLLKHVVERLRGTPLFDARTQSILLDDASPAQLPDTVRPELILVTHELSVRAAAARATSDATALATHAAARAEAAAARAEAAAKRPEAAALLPLAAPRPRARASPPPLAASPCQPAGAPPRKRLKADER